MKYIYCLLFLVAVVMTSCQKENKTSQNGDQLTKNILPLTEEYSWENYDTDNIFGEVLYVPVYSSIYHRSDGAFELTATLSIHNIDINSHITVVKIDYYDTNGEFVKSFIKDEFVLHPLQSKQFIIKEKDISVGTDAKILIKWFSEEKVLKPIVEAVMISTSSQLGISFKTESRVISSNGY